MDTYLSDGRKAATSSPGSSAVLPQMCRVIMRLQLRPAGVYLRRPPAGRFQPCFLSTSADFPAPPQCGIPRRPSHAHLPTWISPVVYPEAAGLRTSTPELLRDAVAADPSRIFVVEENHRISGAELFDAVTRIQQWLQRNGVQAGDCVGMQFPNWWEAVAVAHAAWGLGAVLCPIPVNYRSTEIRAVLDAVTLAAVVIPDTYRGVDRVQSFDEVQATRTLAAPVLLLVIRPEMAPVAYFRTGDSAPILHADLDAISLLMFTSGTTGRAKGVLHSHRTLFSKARFAFCPRVIRLLH
ncbi:hypothetical protein CJ178_30695 [Rhodococcus sp. ACPA4]|nr:hypothetical protein CJ178_30695 [Rhodococcus sp. ACPA4]